MVSTAMTFSQSRSLDLISACISKSIFKYFARSRKALVVCFSNLTQTLTVRSAMAWHKSVCASSFDSPYVS